MKRNLAAFLAGLLFLAGCTSLQVQMNRPLPMTPEGMPDFASNYGIGNLMLQAVSAAIVGGVALSGGSGTPAHVLLGSLILTVMNNGMSLIGMGATGILFANGLVLMGIVLLDGQLGAWMSERLTMLRAGHSA